MDAFICTTCGTQYDPSAAPPPACIICEEERQFVLPAGQSWTTQERLERSHMPAFRDEAGLIGIGIMPAFGINQRALLVPTDQGYVMWDCVSLLSDVMVDLIKGLGGLRAVAISHPHYYTTMVEWGRTFDVPVYVHEADREWIMRKDDCLTLWQGDTREIAPGMTLVRLGGHYDGGTIMHWAQGANGRGALLSGDILQVVADRKHLGFMRSYPNFIPHGAAAVQKISDRVKPLAYDAIYGAFWNAVIATNGKQAMARSVARHLDWLQRDIA
ncbi:MBL fold metallo-hydrolase [Tardiphaga sp. 866_E4_N2_1]|uniref:MBL fold metallo-hydrolase n=1 Tax=unclassified Tardiphaga TaxID=2631404 RepID=UPI003F21E013